MRVHSLRGNWESSGLATRGLGGPHREEYRSTPVMHGPEQSDIAIVPKKPANNAPRRAAERVEGRAVTKGNMRHVTRTGRRAGRACPRRRRVYGKPAVGTPLVVQCRLAVIPKVGAGWGSTSRPDLCRGYRVTGIPTAINVLTAVALGEQLFDELEHILPRVTSSRPHLLSDGDGSLGAG